MNRSNWREELDAPLAVKKTINEFVVTGPAVVGIAKGLGLGTALKTVLGTTGAKVAGAGLVGAGLASATGRKGKKRKKYPDVKHNVGTVRAGEGAGW